MTAAHALDLDRIGVWMSISVSTLDVVGIRNQVVAGRRVGTDGLVKGRPSTRMGSGSPLPAVVPSRPGAEMLGLGQPLHLPPGCRAARAASAAPIASS